MLNYALLALSLVAGVAKNLSSKRVNRRLVCFADYLDVDLVVSLAAVLVFGVLSFFSPRQEDGLFLLFAVLYGLGTFGSQTFFLLAVREGNVGLCSMIYSASFLIPTVYSALLGETLSPFRVAGVCLILVAVVTLSGKSGGMGTASFCFSLAAAASAGAVGILQKEVGRRFGGDYATFYLLIAFAAMFAVSLVARLLSRPVPAATPSATPEADDPASAAAPASRLALLPLACLAACTALANRLNMYLTAVLPGTVFFPVLNGGTVLVSALASALFFREKLTKRTALSLSLGLAALVLYGLG